MGRTFGFGMAAGLIGILAATSVQAITETEGGTGRYVPFPETVRTKVAKPLDVPFYERVYWRPEGMAPSQGYDIKTHEFANDDPAFARRVYEGVFREGNTLSGFAREISRRESRRITYVELWQQNRHLGYDMWNIPIGTQFTYMTEPRRTG